MKDVKSLLSRKVSRTPLFLPALLLGMAMLLGASPATTSGYLSLGDFAILIAGRISLDEAVPALPDSPEAAVLLLRDAGVSLRSDLSSPATAGDASEIFRQFGLSLLTRDPDDLLDVAQARSLVEIFGPTLASKVVLLPPGTRLAVRTAEGPVSTAASIALPETIAECQNLPTTSDCRNCCRTLFGGEQNETHSNRICGRACNSSARRASATEPTP